MSDAPEVRPEDALQVAQRALARLSEVEERMEDLEAENERLEYRVAELEAGLPDENTPYDQLDLDEKVGRVRRYLMKRADASPDGWAKIDYDELEKDVSTLEEHHPELLEELREVVCQKDEPDS